MGQEIDIVVLRFTDKDGEKQQAYFIGQGSAGVHHAGPTYEVELRERETAELEIKQLVLGEGYIITHSTIDFPWAP